MIVTHNRPGHLDDLVGASLLARSHCLDVAFVSPQGMTEADFRHYTVDVGGRYDPARGWFDHHHDANLPCAAHLVAAHCHPEAFSKVCNTPAWRFMDIKDRCGMIAAMTVTGEMVSKAVRAIEGLLLFVQPGADVGHCIANVVFNPEACASYSGFISAIWGALPEQVVLAAKAEAAARMASDDAAIAGIDLQTVTIEGKACVIGVTAAPLRSWRFFRSAKGSCASLLIAYNEIGGSGAVMTRADRCKDSLDLRALVGRIESQGLRPTFIHASGFCAAFNAAPADVAAAVQHFG